MIEQLRKKLNRDEQGISPVIGVIILVGIAAILAAAVGAFALGFTDLLGGGDAPQATIEFDYNADTNELAVVHDGGDSFALPTDVEDNVWEVRVDGNIADDTGGSYNGATVSAGGADWGGLVHQISDESSLISEANTFGWSNDAQFGVGNSVLVAQPSFEEGQEVTVVYTDGGDSGQVIGEFTIPEDSADA